MLVLSNTMALGKVRKRQTLERFQSLTLSSIWEDEILLAIQCMYLKWHLAYNVSSTNKDEIKKR